MPFRWFGGLRDWVCDQYPWLRSNELAIITDAGVTLYDMLRWFLAQASGCVDYFGDLAFGPERWAAMKLLVYGALFTAFAFIFVGCMVTCKAFCDIVCCPFRCAMCPWRWGCGCCRLGKAAFQHAAVISHWTQRRSPSGDKPPPLDPAHAVLVLHGPHGTLKGGRDYWEKVRGRGGDGNKPNYLLAKNLDGELALLERDESKDCIGYATGMLFHYTRVLQCTSDDQQGGGKLRVGGR